MHLDDALNKWLGQMSCSANSRETYSRAFISFNKWLHRNKHYSAMGATVEDLRQYREYLIETKSPYTVCSYIVTLRLFYRFLVENGIKTDNPARYLKGVKRNRYYNKLPLSDSQAKKLLCSVDTSTEKGKRDRLLLLLMLHAGLRCCEVAKMKVEDITEVQGVQSIRIQRKGHSTKDETIPIKKDIVAALDDYANARSRWWNPNDPVIISYQKKRGREGQLSAHAIERIVTRLLRKAGFEDDRITPHSLRHTFACMLVEKGVEIRKIQRLMGHVSSQITEIYTKMQDERKIFEDNPAELLDSL